MPTRCAGTAVYLGRQSRTPSPTSTTTAHNTKPGAHHQSPTTTSTPRRPKEARVIQLPRRVVTHRTRPPHHCKVSPTPPPEPCTCPRTQEPPKYNARVKNEPPRGNRHTSNKVSRCGPVFRSVYGQQEGWSGAGAENRGRDARARKIYRSPCNTRKTTFAVGRETTSKRHTTCAYYKS